LIQGSHTLLEDLSKILSVHPVGNGHPTLFWAEEGEGGEEDQ